MKFIISLILISNILFAEDDDIYNKMEHVALHAAMSTVVANVAYQYDFTISQSWWIGFGTSMAIAFAWEASNTNFGAEDFASDAVGSALGASSLFIIYEW